ncbi:MAG: TonB-dependent receptor, partial [Phaeodactylibacter sp.]|nr:TonB-dependent receptor [Phaeodactylibacter sp.]
ENWDFTYGFHYSTTTDYSRYDRLLRTRQGRPRSAEWYYGPQAWLMNNLNITQRSATGLYDQAVLRIAQQSFEESRIDRDFNDTERRSRLEKVAALSANLDLHKAIGQAHGLLYGLEAVYNDVESSGADEDISTGKVAPGPARYPQSSWASYAAYLTYQYRASERLLLQAGARYNQFALDATFDTTFYPFPFTSADINKGALTGSLGLVYNTPSLWTLSANLSTGFRSPNVDDVGKVFDSEPGSVVVPNPGLEAEYAYNAEIGLAKVAGDAVRVDLSAYYTVLENALVRRAFTLNGQDSILYDGELSQVQAIQNAANAYIYGVQAALEVKLPGGFSLLSRFNYQKGEEELDDGSTSPLRHAAPWFGLSRLAYTNDRLRLELSANYSGEVSYDNLAEEERGKDYLYAVDDNGNPYSPSWYTLDFRASMKLTEQLSVTGGVENLTDQRYRPYSSGLAGAGRNVVLSLRAKF